MNIPDYIEPFTAYRVWQWDSEGIKSINHSPWTPGEATVATCDRAGHDVAQWLDKHGVTTPSHDVPNEGCTCGMYAARDFQHLIDINYVEYGIHGEVALWGKIRECTLGYRAQYAYPKFFIIPPNMLTWDMADVERRLQTLIQFNVDIYVSTSNIPESPCEKIPLWVKDFGFSQQGIGFLVKRIQRFYSFKDDRPNDNPEVGERISLKNKGIGIISSVNHEIVGVRMFNLIHDIPRERVVWSFQNNRWECDGTNIMTRVYFKTKSPSF